MLQDVLQLAPDVGQRAQLAVRATVDSDAALTASANGTATASASSKWASAAHPQHKEEALLGVVRQLRPVSFRYKENAESKHSRYGFVAQELEALLPAVVHADPVSGFRFVRYTDLLAVLVLGAQQVEALATSAELELDALDARINSDAALLDPRLAALERALVDIVASGTTGGTGASAPLVAGNITASPASLAHSERDLHHLREMKLKQPPSSSLDSDALDLLAELETLASVEPIAQQL